MIQVEQGTRVGVLPPIRLFHLLRYTLIVAVTYLLLAEYEFATPPAAAILLIALALASNVASSGLSESTIRSPWFAAAVVIGDTAWTTTVLILSNRFNAEFFFLYFFVLLLAGVGENLLLIAISAVAVCIAYVYLLSAFGGTWSFWHSPSLIRIPFLFTVAAFYGHLVDQVRRERTRAERGEVGRHRAEEALRQSEERYRRVCELTADYAYAIHIGADGSFGYEWVAGAFERITGYSPEEFKRAPAWLRLIHADDLPAVLRIMQATLSGESGTNELRIVRRDGALRWVRDSRRAEWSAAQGRVIRILGAVEDITARKRAEEEVLELNAALERRVDERTAQLAAANDELQAFTYSVSHDLRAPLRAIDVFSEDLLRENEGQLDADALRLVGRVRLNVGRMTQLIDDLIELSRATTHELRVAKVDMSALAAQIAHGLRERSPQRRIELKVADNVLTRGDKNLLGIALQSLLDNAWKYSQRQPLAQIEFGVIEQPGHLEYFVRDNGAGFDMKYADKLFVPFQRLHSAAEFEGTGIGLATVERIVRRHGGRLRAEGVVGQGATFYFTLNADTLPCA